MRAETYAVVNLAALNLIEAASAAYFVSEKEAVTRHEFRAREMLKKIAAALGYEVAEVAWRERRTDHASDAASPPAAPAALKLVCARPSD